MTREEDGKSEPWTWVRNYGKGRVFYTASGHDERTWEHPGFQELVKRGILWAVGDRVRGLWETYHETMPQLKYQAEVGPIPIMKKEILLPNFKSRSPPKHLKS